LQRLLTSKSMQQLVNEVDGVGNPKGEVYSRAELRDLLRRFDDLKLFAGLLQGGMLLPRGNRFLPRRLLQRFEPQWGWFLYAKGIKPQTLP
jgi:hypothetical protein